MRLLTLSAVALSASLASAAVIPMQTPNQVSERQIQPKVTSLVQRDWWNPLTWGTGYGDSPTTQPTTPEVNPQSDSQDPGHNSLDSPTENENENETPPNYHIPYGSPASQSPDDETPDVGKSPVRGNRKDIPQEEPGSSTPNQIEGN